MPLPSDITETVTNTLQTVTVVTGSDKLHDWVGRTTDYLSAHGKEFANGTVVLVIGIVVTGWIARGLSHWMEKRRKLEPPERLLLIVVVRVLLVGLTINVALDVSGHPFGAVLGGLGVLAVGLGFALQGLLSNILSGLTLIFTKPFRVGEYVEILGVEGLVTHIDLFSTKLQKLDHSKLVIPNNKITAEVLHNFGPARQVQITMGIAYGTNVKEARRLAEAIFAKNPIVLTEPAPRMLVTSLQESAIGLTAQIWVKIADYEFARSEISEALVECFRENKIEIPFPRREVRVLQHESSRLEK